MRLTGHDSLTSHSFPHLALSFLQNIYILFLFIEIMDNIGPKKFHIMECVVHIDYFKERKYISSTAHENREKKTQG